MSKLIKFVIPCLILVGGFLFYSNNPSQARQLQELRSQLKGDGCSYTLEYGSNSSCKRGFSFYNKTTVRNPEYFCPLYAAECISSMGEVASSAVPDILSRIESWVDSYDTGDGVIPVRAVLINSLKSFQEHPQLASSMQRVIEDQSSSVSSKKSALELITLLGKGGLKLEGTLIDLINQDDARLRVEALKALVNTESDKASSQLRAILVNESSNYPLMYEVLSVLTKAPNSMQAGLQKELKDLFAVTMDSVSWESRVKKAESPEDVKAVKKERDWLFLGFLRNKRNFEFFKGDEGKKLIKEMLAEQKKWRGISRA